MAPPRKVKNVRNGQSLPPPVPDRPKALREAMAHRITDLSQLDPLRKSESKQSLDGLDNELVSLCNVIFARNCFCLLLI